MADLHLSDGEWKLMKGLWQQSPRTLGALVAALAPTTGWSKATVFMMLKRLIAKGAVSLDESGKYQQYSAAVAYAEVEPEETASFLTKVYGANGHTMDELMQWVEDYAMKIVPHLANTTKLLRAAQAEGKSILFEAQLGALRDLDYGIYPYTTSSNAIAAYAPVGSGLPTAKLDEVVGVVKAYSSCVGEGPFTCEWFGDEAAKLREAGAEFGAKTGRPRRVGPIDLVATRYGVEMQGATSIALTKLDVLSYMDKIPLCAHYEIDGVQTDDFPFPVLLDRAKPVMEYMPGWQCDISGARRWEDLPEAARSYVEYVEKAIGCPIDYVSVGAERESLILR